MSLLDDKLKELKELKSKAQVTGPKPRIRLCEQRQRWVMRMKAVLEHRPASNVGELEAKRQARLERKAMKVSLAEGQCCPKCHGTGYWTHPDTLERGVCYWCNDPRQNGGGKGYLTAKDLSFINARAEGAGRLNVGASA